MCCALLAGCGGGPKHDLSEKQLSLAVDAQRPSLERCYQKALETSRLRREVRAIRTSQSQEFGLGAIIGESPAMQHVKDLLGKVASSRASTVLLTGETGTGKDLAAKAIHYSSDRASKAFVNITCSALPEQLLEMLISALEIGLPLSSAVTQTSELSRPHLKCTAMLVTSAPVAT